jgi:hypothetical protein
VTLGDRGWDPDGPVRWEAESLDRAVVLWIDDVPLLRLRRKGRRWIFEATREQYDCVDRAADAAEIWLYNVLGYRWYRLPRPRLELLAEYVDFLTIPDDEPRRGRRLLSAFDARLESAELRGTYRPQATALQPESSGGYRPAFCSSIS